MRNDRARSAVKEKPAMTGKAKDHDEIVRVINLYVDGFNNNDIAEFKEAFYEDAWIFHVNAEGKLTKNRTSENVADWARPPSWEIVGRSVTVTQVGDVASVYIVCGTTPQDQIKYGTICII